MEVAGVVKFVGSVLRVEPSAQDLATPPLHIGSTCHALASRSATVQQLLRPDSVAASAEVLQWLTAAGADLATLTDAKLAEVNKTLENRTFLVGNQLTLADLVIFGVTLPATTTFPSAQHKHFCNLLRWADHIQALAGAPLVAASFSCGALSIPLPPYVPPPSPAPTPAAAPAPAAAQPAAAATAPKAAAAAAAPAASKPAAKPAAADGVAKAAAAAPEAKAKKEAAQKAPGGGASGKKDDAGGADDEARIDMLDLRVGVITKVGKHPNADALYVEEIDVGEPAPRQIISGLVKFVPVEAMQGRTVVVVCNLKPAKMRDVMSYGMVLCASNETHDTVVPVTVPSGTRPGARVTVTGYDQPPLAEVNPKKKVLERLFPDMKTNADGVPCYKGVPFVVEAGGQLASPVPNGWVK